MTQCQQQTTTAAAAGDSFKFSDLRITNTQDPQPQRAWQELRFGHHFTDHMFIAEHCVEEGWGQPEIRPMGFISLHPAAQVLHYGMCCFEGMKAYAGADGRGRLFRPARNMERLRRSMQRLLLADFEPDELLQCLKALLRIDRPWQPEAPGYSMYALLRVDRPWLPEAPSYSMYVRPMAFSSTGSLGITAPSRTTLMILLSPAGPYFGTGLRPVQLFVDEVNVRAWPGGAGDQKIGSNYAPTITPLVDAFQRHGAAQVVCTLPQGPDPDAALFSESGGMNIMFFMDKASGGGQELVTAPLDGTILPGITRASILELARGWGDFDVSERPISIREVQQAVREGRLREVFGCGTACMVQPVDRLLRESGEAFDTPFDAEDPNTLTARLTRTLGDIQYGRVAHEWSVPFE
ncbi:hypothetical protein WJX81_006118 [Elliptochloris bilobata]|uniref:Branched-chain-amino-acid transaminase n=1 Tax=Elliptochloris bilobata TaxID=381761 RepID=A0AAW1RRA6_9CHLO